jgi:hypothetical protein
MWSEINFAKLLAAINHDAATNKKNLMLTVTSWYFFKIEIQCENENFFIKKL